MPVTLIKTKWVSGELVFYDKATGNEIFRVKDGTGGVDFSQPIAVESQIIKGARFAVNAGPYAAAAITGTESVFFVAPAPCKLISAIETHETAAASAGFIDIYKNGTGVALGAGVAMLSTGFVMYPNATADMYVAKDLTDSTGVQNLTTGDRISIKATECTQIAGAMIGLVMEWV